MIDLRSDTVTKPTPGMRRAMAEAEVGDDVYGEDPTVNRLEQRAAEIAGKEAALFVPTGTMGNTIAVKLHTEHGQEVICDSRAHLLDWELSMVAWFSGCLIRAIPTDDGILSLGRKCSALIKAPESLLRAHRADRNREHAQHAGRHGLPASRPSTRSATARMSAACKVHMDGARIFNAADAAGVPVRDIAAPGGHRDVLPFERPGRAGRLHAGRPAELIAKGRLYRKRLGGGMRQVGVLAAAGLIALEESPKQLAADHANARFLAEGLARIPGIQIAPETSATNIVVFDVSGTGRAPARNQRAAQTARRADECHQ